MIYLNKLKANTHQIQSPVYPQTMWYCWPGKTLV